MRCINDRGCHLTFGNYYEVLYNDGDYITIINDIGKRDEYSITRFENKSD